MPSDPLPLRDIKARLNAGSLGLNEETVGQDCLKTLTESFRQRTEALELTGCKVVEDGGDAFVTFDGTFSRLNPWDNVGVKFTLFDHSTSEGSKQRHSVFAIAVPRGYGAYRYLSQYILDGAGPADENLIPFNPNLADALDSIEFAGSLDQPAELVFSSLDYSAVAPGAIYYPQRLEALLPARDVGKGVNFLAAISLDEDLTQFLAEVFKGSPDKGGADRGLIYPREDGPYFRFRKTIKAEQTVGSLSLELEGMAFVLPLSWGNQGGAQILLDGAVRLGDRSFRITADFDAYYRQVALSIKDFPSLSELIKLTGLKGLDAYFPEPLASLLDVKLSKLGIVLSLANGGSIRLVSVSLTTNKEVELIAPKKISIQPSLEMRVYAPFDERFREIEGELKGDWQLGTTKFETALSYPSYAFYARMAERQTLDAKALVAKVLSGIELPELQLTKMEVYGNFLSKSFSAEIEVDGKSTWAFELAGKQFGVDSIKIGMSYEDGQIASCSLDGRLGLAGVDVFVSAQYAAKRWTLLGGTASGAHINLKTGLTDLLQSLSLQDLPDLKLTNIVFFASPQTSEYSISGQTAEPWKLLDGLSLQVEEFRASCKEKDVTGVLTVILTIDSIIVRLSAKKAAAAQGGGWQFEGSTGQGQDIKIDTLIKGLPKGFGDVSLPDSIKDCAIRNLSIAFNSESKNFTFTCEGAVRLPETKTEINGTIVIEIERQNNGSYKKTFGGSLVIRPKEAQPLNFSLVFATDKVQAFLATYHGEQKISIDSLLKQVFTDPITTGVELTLKDALFAYRGDEVGAKYLFGINIGIKIGLAKLPVVGPALPAGLEFSVEDLQILAATRAFTLTQVNALNSMMPGTATKLPSQKPDGGDTALRQGLNVSAKLKLAGADKLLMLPAAETSAAPETSAPAESSISTATDQPGTSTAVAKAKPSAGLSKWFEIDKSLGPLTVRRIGLAYEAPKVGIKFDASLQLSFLTFNLEGLGLRYPLGGSTEPAEVFKNLEPTLDGMGLALGNGPIEIGGSLVRVPRTDQKLELEGALLIRTAPFTFSALGSYVDLNGTISVMAFAVLLRELGDPTGTGAFVVTGLAFGFGVNRKLTIPRVEEVQNFPLIQAAMGKQDFKSLAVLPGKLRDYVSPAVGNFWIAGGIKFNSFAMVDSFLLLSVSWGAEVEIALLGLSRMTVPPLVQQDQAVAGAELALRGVIRIADGLIQFEARLTENSFIFSKACRLYGGFAFCVWFAGPHAGDFVVSLGGYHPAFARPAHYPLVRRLGMQLQIGTELCITGEAYFALTPSCIMAGGKLCAVFKSSGIEAWFIAYVDFLMNWQPFYYQAAMGITLGVALRLGGIAMRLEVSVDLRLQGPPFGGEARVVLWVISFTIPFGERASAPPPLKPREFVNNCLPAPKDPKKDKSPDVFSVRITGGLLREQEIKGQNRTHRIVNAHRLSLIAQSVIPCTEFGGLAKGLGAKASCGIRPMGKTNLKSVFSVTADGIIPGQHVKVSAITGNVPDAVWGKSEEEGLVPLLETPERKTIEAALGIRMVSIPQDPVHGLPAIAIEKFDYEPIPKNVDWAVRNLPKYVKPEEKWTNYTAIWSDDSVRQRRNDVLACLRQQLPPDLVLNEPHLERLSVTENYFQQQPEMNAVGY